jgi:hypothetical protein
MLGMIPGWVVMSALLLLGFAFVGGAIWTLRGSSAGGSAAQGPIPKIELLDLAFESSPMGADVFIVGSNEYLGRTPFRRKVEYRTDRTTFVVYRLAGYVEKTEEVRPEWSGGVTLQPAPVPPPARAPARAVSPPPAPTPAVAPRPVPTRPAVKTDPFEKLKPTRHRSRGKGKGKARVGVPERDPFEGRSGGPTRKASPFE